MQKTLQSTIKPGDIIDTHVHIGGPRGENETMYFWSEMFRRSMAFEAMRLVVRLGPMHSTGWRYVDVLSHQLQMSRHVDKAVLLALDRVYSEDGQALDDATHLYVANAYVGHLAEITPSFLFGCSIHPYAPDALERLWHSVRAGAVLCKWLPSVQGIDPTHPLAERFYRALAELRLPLLIHVGPENAIPSDMARDEAYLVNAASGQYGHAAGDAIVMALEAGATVVVAHCATPVGPLLDKDNDYWEGVFQALLERADEFQEMPLYADTSAFCLPGRLKYVKRILPRITERPHKFLYGSDYPVPVISLSAGKAVEEVLEAFGWLAGRALPLNDFDKNYRLLKPHLPDEVFRTAASILRDPQSPCPDWGRFRRRLGLKRRRFFRL